MTPDDRLRDLLADVRAEIDGAVGGRYDGLAWVARRIEAMLAEGAMIDGVTDRLRAQERESGVWNQGTEPTSVAHARDVGMPLCTRRCTPEAPDPDCPVHGPRRHGREYTDPEVAAMYAQASAVDEWDAADHGLLQPMLDASVPAYAHDDGRLCWRRKATHPVLGEWWPSRWESGQMNGSPETGCPRPHEPLGEPVEEPNESRERQ